MAGSSDWRSHGIKVPPPLHPCALPCKASSTAEDYGCLFADACADGSPPCTDAHAAQGGGTAEDDGYLLTYVTDETTAQSELAIYSAKTMSSQPVCRLRLPQRVPMGFHGTWVSAAQLAEQRA